MVVDEPQQNVAPRQHRLARSDYPALYAAAAAGAVAGRRAHAWLTRLELGLLLAASGLSATEAHIENHLYVTSFRVAAAVVLALAFVLKFANKVRAFDAVWFECRSVAEGAKSDSWRYMMRAEPFAGTDADVAFLAHLERGMAAHRAVQRELHRLPVAPRQITPRMRAERAQPFTKRKATYLEARIADQLDWYRRAARTNHRWGDAWFVLSLVALAAALGLAIAAVATGSSAGLVSGAAAISAAATAWDKTGRGGDLARTYGLAAQTLTLRQGEVEAATGNAALAQAVDATERSIASEHEAWTAKRQTS